MSAAVRVAVRPLEVNGDHTLIDLNTAKKYTQNEIIQFGLGYLHGTPKALPLITS